MPLKSCLRHRDLNPVQLCVDACEDGADRQNLLVARGGQADVSNAHVRGDAARRLRRLGADLTPGSDALISAVVEAAIDWACWTLPGAPCGAPCGVACESLARGPSDSRLSEASSSQSEGESSESSESSSSALRRAATGVASPGGGMFLPGLSDGGPCCVRLFCAVAATTAGPRPSFAIASDRSCWRSSAASRAFFRVEAPTAVGIGGAPCSVWPGPSGVVSAPSRSSSSTV